MPCFHQNYYFLLSNTLLVLKEYPMNLTTNVNVTKDNKHQLPCVKCIGSTEHVVLASIDQDGDDKYEELQWSNNYQIVQCCGCKSISYRFAHINSEDYVQVSAYEYDDQEPEYNSRVFEDLYPSRVNGRQSLEAFYHYFPAKVLRVYQETLKAINNDSPVLSGIGLRALVETICKDNAAEGSDLFKKIESLVKQSVLTPKGSKILHKIRTLGNDAAHEVKPHNTKQLSLAMDVIEHILREIYILPKQVDAEFGE